MPAPFPTPVITSHSQTLARFILAILTMWGAQPYSWPAGIQLVSTHFTSDSIDTFLTSEMDCVQPGGTFWIALIQKMPPGYHTYWRNPGTVGLATDMEWSVPDGVSVGPVMWPVPQKTRMAAYDVWGYEGRVALLVPVHISDSVPLDSLLELKASVQWMSCGRQCFPGFAEMSLSIPVRKDTPVPIVEDWIATAINQTRNQQPTPTPEHWTIQTCFSAETEKIGLIIQDGKPESTQFQNVRDGYFYGFDRVVSSARSQSWSHTSQGFSLSAFQEEFSPKATGTLSGILVLTYSDQSQKIYSIESPLQLRHDP